MKKVWKLTRLLDIKYGDGYGRNTRLYKSTTEYDTEDEARRVANEEQSRVAEEMKVGSPSVYLVPRPTPIVEIGNIVVDARRINVAQFKVKPVTVFDDTDGDDEDPEVSEDRKESRKADEPDPA